MNLKSITFGFENCEIITIEGKYVCQFLVDNFHTYFSRVACNAIEKVDIAETFAIEIAALADGPYNPFGRVEWGSTKFKRFLAYNDITSIQFTLYDDDGENEQTYYYWTKWVGDNEEINDGQYTYLSNLGNLYIVISKDKKFEDFFDKETINDEDAVNLHFDMCDVPRRRE